MHPPSPSLAASRPRKWDVVHACDHARQVADVLDAQACANIRAYIVSHPRPPNDSLLRSWGEVRKWSSLLSQHVGDPPFDSAGLLIHAHNFTAGMAAIRSQQPSVYDVETFVDQVGAETARPWLGRSFRAAEQFVLAQAAAVVVHDRKMENACRARGVSAERVFCVPPPAPLMPDVTPGEQLRRRFAIAENEVAVLVETMDRWLAAVFLAVHSRSRNLRLLLAESASAGMASIPQADAIAQISISLSPDYLDAAASASDLVIAAHEPSLVSAMVYGKPTVAADTEELRSVSAEGVGLLWSEAADLEDRARKVESLLRDAETRASLGAAARRFIQSQRSLERIGKLYEDVYRFAAEGHDRSRNVPPNGTLVPVTAN